MSCDYRSKVQTLDTSEGIDVEFGDLIDEMFDFSAGNFDYDKIKSHSWWSDLVYD
jgi:UDP-galactopyranose mutase